MTAVETLVSAREASVERKQQLILLDIELPDGNGLDLMGDIGHITPHPAIVVIRSRR